MSSTSPQNVIQRFTYDWLIRFCELHPTDSNNFICPHYLNQTDFLQIPYIHARPLSRYSIVSELFDRLTKRYTPLIVHGNGYMYQDEMLKFVIPKTTKTVVLTGFVKFLLMKAGTITKYIEQKKIFFNLERLVISTSILQPSEFTYLVRQCKTVVCIDCSLTKPLPYSKVWPLISHCITLNLDVRNLYFDDKMSHALTQTAENGPWFVTMRNLCLNEETVFPIVNYYMTVPNGHFVQMMFQKYDSKRSCKSMAKTVKTMFTAAGFTVDISAANENLGFKRTITIKKMSNDLIRIRFSRPATSMHVQGNVIM
uniref:FBA_2 domain-containing protein n=1 Tax=Panagrellus redivivus TaxID=6233 RepID=A0A7E4WA84_PANRE